MSIHFRKPNYECPKCQSLFIPYKAGIKCPNCGIAVEDADIKEHLNAIELIASSMEMHKNDHGRYFPGAWYSGDFMDNIQGLTYRIFDAMEETKPENEEQYLLDLLENKFTWEGQLYLKGHMKDITSEVFKIYKVRNLSAIKRYELTVSESDEADQEDQLTKWEGIKMWFKKFLP